MEPIKVLGMMSGTSLDGVDLALVEFTGTQWRLVAAKTFPYESAMRLRLDKSLELSGVELSKLDRELGGYFGKLSTDFLKEHEKTTDFIASHGHTVFHQPKLGLTVQIGHPAVLSSVTRIPVIADFRSQDVSLGGEGAPLVPKGDADLFPEYTACLNLGGIANISYQQDGKRVAGDITVCNMALNKVSERLGYDFDQDGKLAESGKIISELLEKINNLPFHHRIFPKSTGREWFEKEILPLLTEDYSPVDLLATLTDVIATQIATHINGLTSGKVLITGGGAKNKHLIDILRKKSKPEVEIVVPDDDIVDFKEAIIFAYLGYLRVKGLPSTLASVTGASREVSAGCLYLP